MRAHTWSLNQRVREDGGRCRTADAGQKQVPIFGKRSAYENFIENGTNAETYNHSRHSKSHSAEDLIDTKYRVVEVKYRDFDKSIGGNLEDHRCTNRLEGISVDFSNQD